MKHIISFLYTIVIPISIFCQGIGWGASCNNHDNVNSWIGNNNPPILNSNSGIISATFEFGTEAKGYCTGTLINRKTSEGEVGFYFLTAKHCINELSLEIDGTTISVFEFRFNYQSPNTYSLSTPETNRGWYNGQSGLNDSITGDKITNGFEYYHLSKMRIVNDPNNANSLNLVTGGDLALVEILTPIPPHFNVAYAGWNPNFFYYEGNIYPPINMLGDFKMIHHPKADIKKIAKTPLITNPQTAITTGCYAVTTVINVIFGWIWGNTVSTQLICGYTEYGYFLIPAWTQGGAERGSSGAGFFNSWGNQIGVYKGVLGPDNSCNSVNVSQITKFYSNYAQSSIKNTLNPSQDVWTDLFGIEGRKITCYDNLTLPGSVGVSGQYFPAKHYQPNNEISLKAAEKIETTQFIYVHPSANYEFKAGKSITLNPGFKADTGAVFKGNIEECVSSRVPENETKNAVLAQLKEIKIPKNMSFDLKKYVDNEDIVSEHKGLFISILPNPNQGDFQYQVLGLHATQTAKFRLFDMTGKELLSFDKEIRNEQFEHISINELPNGMYFLEVLVDNRCLTQKIIKN